MDKSKEQQLEDLNLVDDLKEKTRLLLLAVWGLDAIAAHSMIEQPWTTPILTLANEVDTMVGKLGTA